MLVSQRFYFVCAVALSSMINFMQAADEDASFWEKNKGKIAIGVAGVATVGFLSWRYYNALTSTSSTSDKRRQLAQTCTEMKDHLLTSEVGQDCLIAVGTHCAVSGIEKIIDMTKLLVAPSQRPLQPEDITTILPSEQVINMSPSIIQDLVKDLKVDCFEPEDFDTGFLLYGPSGTGKTELAKALCLHLNIPVFCLKSSEFRSDQAGQRSINLKHKLKSIFSSFDRRALLFIDEIDSIAMKRDRHISEEDKQVVAALIHFIDEIEANHDKKLILLGATRYIEGIDRTFLDRMQLVKMSLPSEELRRLALDAYLSHYFADQSSRDVVFSQELKESIVKVSEGFSYRRLLSFVQSVYRHCDGEEAITAAVILEELKEHFCQVDKKYTKKMRI